MLLPHSQEHIEERIAALKEVLENPKAPRGAKETEELEKKILELEQKLKYIAD